MHFCICSGGTSVSLKHSPQDKIQYTYVYVLLHSICCKRITECIRRRKISIDFFINEKLFTAFGLRFLRGNA